MTRKRYCAQIEDTIDTILPRETPVTIWFYDTAARIHFGPQKLQEGSELRPVEKDILAYHSDNQGTKQSVPLLAMLPVVKALDSKGDSSVCMLLTDSEDDDSKATKKVARSWPRSTAYAPSASAARRPRRSTAISCARN